MDAPVSSEERNINLAVEGVRNVPSSEKQTYARWLLGIKTEHSIGEQAFYRPRDGGFINLLWHEGLYF